MVEQLIEVQNISKSFNGHEVVNNISFTVNEGETLILLGKSGCGKTTLLKMINRLLEPTSGTITINNKNISLERPEQLRKNIGYVIQNIGLFPHYTVEQNIEIVPLLLKWGGGQRKKRVHELLDLVGLSPKEFLNRYPHELSGGQKQRVGLIRALASDPPIVLLDEPFGALDPITRKEIQNEFKHLEVLINKTMILVTHDVFEAFYLGDRICLMNAGKVEQIGTSQELVFSPRSVFVKDFFKPHKEQLDLLANYFKK